MQHSVTNVYGDWFLRILFASMALFLWGAVFLKYTIVWKGGNRAPLSTQSKIVSAVGMSGLCLAVFGIYPLGFSAVFAVGICYLMIQSERDRAAYEREHGLAPVKPLVPITEQWWLGLCAADGFVLLGSLFAVIRDSRFPPGAEEQRIVHVMGIGLLALSGVGAIALFISRPKST